ncbi:unnamed protein product [Didymodactylos carnosus]|uniref:Large ribosomal subunit protein uL15m n=1 Tax=Didymodactylos carnosus TaxID=1234261 RepID=A0A813R8S1_9BILA|nr:unnamed protein product [Didymodactylos carnosus]CAF3560231.1 unnamed protein product [Didymodactylos carnosus]
MKKIDVATEFLRNPKIASNSIENKREFLRKKGLTDFEINHAFNIVPQDDGIKNNRIEELSQTQQQSSVFRKIITDLAILGLLATAFITIKRWFQSKNKNEIVDALLPLQTSVRDMCSSIAKLEQSVNQLTKSVNEIKEKNTDASSCSVSINEMKQEIQTLKGLLLSRQQFPSPPQIQARIPSWQLETDKSKSGTRFLNKKSDITDEKINQQALNSLTSTEDNDLTQTNESIIVINKNENGTNPDETMTTEKPIDEQLNKASDPDDSKIKANIGRKGPIARESLPPWGIEPTNANGRLPWILQIPKEPYYEGVEEARQYLPMSLRTLQRLIDLRRINPLKPIDLPVLCNTKLFAIDPEQRQFGLQLVDDGADIFATPINLEVQWVSSEVAIAAIERCGGVLTTRYFDPISLTSLIDAKKFFERSEPIPRCDTPPINAIEFYTNAKNRGYLCDPDLIREERHILAQKFGYTIPDISKTNPSLYNMLRLRKDPRQIFYGLEPGWVINLKDKSIHKPKDEKYEKFYHS